MTQPTTSQVDGRGALKTDGRDCRPRASRLLALATLCCVFPLCWIAGALGLTAAAAVLGGPRMRGGVLAYLIFVFTDKSPKRGGYWLLWRLGITDRLRRAAFWRWGASYFPITMRATAPLPADDGPYIFVCHPHGIIGISPMTSFGTEATGFSKLFPGNTVHLLGHNAIFRIPLFREWCLAHGHGSVDKPTCVALLREGHSIALAPGGAKESLESVPGTMRCILKQRKGFAKLALETGASLVPVIGFGENDTYDTVHFPPGTRCRAAQDFLQRKLGFALPVFCGRSWMPLLPKKVPICTVVGAPICPRALLGERAGVGGLEEQVTALHTRYCEALQDLFMAHRAEHGAASVELQIV